MSHQFAYQHLMGVDDAVIYLYPLSPACCWCHCEELVLGVFLLPYVPSNHFYCSGLVSPHLLSPGLLTVSERGLSLYKCGLPCLVWLVSFTGASQRMVLVSFSFSL